MLLKCYFNPLHRCGVEEGLKTEYKVAIVPATAAAIGFPHAYAMLMQQHLGDSCNMLLQLL